MALLETNSSYVDLILHWLDSNNRSGAVDYTQPYVKNSLLYVYPLFMFLHAVIGLFGVVGNVGIIFVICKNRLFHDQTFLFLINIAFSDLLKCIFVLPMTLANLLIQNWLFGSFMCFFLPMMQSFPMKASMLTFLMIGIDRYRIIVNPFQSRMPAGLCIIAVWVAAVCVVLPFAVYIKYIDLEALLGPEFNGVGICYVSTSGSHIEEYIRAVFVTLYVLPLAIIGFLYVKISAEIKSRETAALSVHYDAHRDIGTEFGDWRHNTAVTWTNGRAENKLEPDPNSAESTQIKSYNEYSTQDSDDDLDLPKEKRTQNYLASMTTIFAICWFPLQILILVTYFVHENEDNMGYYDVTYLIFTCFGFLSTCTTPVLFASWRMSATTKDRLKGYFRFSNRKSNGQDNGTDEHHST